MAQTQVQVYNKFLGVRTLKAWPERKRNEAWDAGWAMLPPNQFRQIQYQIFVSGIILYVNLKVMDFDNRFIDILHQCAFCVFLRRILIVYMQAY